MFPKTNFEKKLNVKIATSNRMDDAINLWLSMYENKPPWLGGDADVKSLNIPSAISEEMARLVLTEFTFELAGGERASFIQDAFGNFLTNFSSIVELWCALGGIVVKPYVGGSKDAPDSIYIDIIQANRFYPTAYNSNREITGAVFIETKRIGDYLYTRLEYHTLECGRYMITNKAFRSERLHTFNREDDDILSISHPLQNEVSLEEVDEWKGLAPVTELENIERPFFVYVKVPRANNIDPHSPLGASIYSRATDVIKEVDRQFSRTLWEYEATEAAVDADISLFDTDKRGNPIMPKGKNRMFRTYNFEGSGNAGFLKEYAPDIRDASLFNGLNELVRKVEFLCSLAYGTLSDPSDVAKTATEVKASKQRSYTTVNAMQKTWDAALDNIIAVMDTLCTLYNIAPAGAIEKQCTWGDGVLEDTEAEYQRRWSMVLAGKMKIEMFYSWYFGCSEEEARNYVPDAPAYPPPE